jgi:hypothetical protein
MVVSDFSHNQTIPTTPGTSPTQGSNSEKRTAIMSKLSSHKKIQTPQLEEGNRNMFE